MCLHRVLLLIKLNFVEAFVVTRFILCFFVVLLVCGILYKILKAFSSSHGEGYIRCMIFTGKDCIFMCNFSQGERQYIRWLWVSLVKTL